MPDRFCNSARRTCSKVGTLETVKMSMCAPTTRGPYPLGKVLSGWGRHHCQTKFRDTICGGDGKAP